MAVPAAISAGPMLLEAAGAGSGVTGGREEKGSHLLCTVALPLPGRFCHLSISSSSAHLP